MTFPRRKYHPRKHDQLQIQQSPRGGTEIPTRPKPRPHSHRLRTVEICPLSFFNTRVNTKPRGPNAHKNVKQENDEPLRRRFGFREGSSSLTDVLFCSSQNNDRRMLHHGNVLKLIRIVVVILLPIILALALYY